jgi:hypothetical protein
MAGCDSPKPRSVANKEPAEMQAAKALKGNVQSIVFAVSKAIKIWPFTGPFLRPAGSCFDWT